MGTAEMSDKKKWLGVDLDGTLARDDLQLAKPSDIGPPVSAMVARIKRWLSVGYDVRIVTARVSEVGAKEFGLSVEGQHKQIAEWLLEHIGQVLPVQCHKDYLMVALYDDRAVTVVRNTGVACGHICSLCADRQAR